MTQPKKKSLKKEIIIALCVALLVYVLQVDIDELMTKVSAFFSK